MVSSKLEGSEIEVSFGTSGLVYLPSDTHTWAVSPFRGTKWTANPKTAFTMKHSNGRKNETGTDSNA
jgi:hypothetical protein